MRIVIITQDDPFYLAKNLDYLFSLFSKEHEVVGCVVSSVSPFGKKETFIDKALKTAKIFGFKFFLRYALKFISSKFSFKNNVRNVLIKHGVEEINLTGSINSKESLDSINSFKPDLLISIAGNEIFKLPLIELASKGCLNLHTALLPKYRGLMPSFWVLKNREKYSGVSVFFVDEGIDSGPILVQKKFSLIGLSQERLINESKKLGMEAINEAVEKINNNNIATIPNPNEEQSYFGFPTSQDVQEFKKVGAKFY
jgi:methionyl-tRNA formyltransferase